MENTNLKNDIFNESKNLRNYDKEPLVLKDYENFFTTNLLTFPLLFAFTIIITIWSFFDNDSFLETIMRFIFLVLILFFELSITYKFAKNNKNRVIFKNNVIEFYQGQKLVRISENKNLNSIICKPFSDNNGNGDTGIRALLLFVCVLICISIFMSFGLKGLFLGALGIFCYIFGNIIVKIYLHFKLNGNLKYFTIFPNIIVDYPKSEKGPIGYVGTGLTGKNFLIHIVNNEQYYEIKKYFLQQGINIDNLPKIYSIF